jgi:hypothetical protein
MDHFLMDRNTTKQFIFTEIDGMLGNEDSRLNISALYSAVNQDVSQELSQ